MALNEKIFETVLSATKFKILRLVDGFIWLSMIFVSYSHFVKKIDIGVLLKSDKSLAYILSGDYILICSWAICIIALYVFIKYLLTNLLPSSILGVRIFLFVLVPFQYRNNLLNLYLKKAHGISKDNIKLALLYWDDEKEEKLNDTKIHLGLLFGSSLKFCVVAFLLIGNYGGNHYLIILMSAIIASLFSIFLLSLIIKVEGKKMIYGLVSSFID